MGQVRKLVGKVRKSVGKVRKLVGHYLSPHLAEDAYRPQTQWVSVMAVVTASTDAAECAQTILFSKWGDLLGSLGALFKGKFECVVKAMGTCMQCFQEAVAYFRLRNQREEQRQMHITNGNIPAKIRAGSKLKKAPTPNMTKVKVVSVLEAQQMPKASHTYDTLRHKNAKRMNEIASMPCHEIFPAIEKWRQECPTSESNDASLVPPRPPAGRADEAEAEFQPVLSRRKVKAAKREANLAAKRKLDAAHWNAPILTAPPVRGVEGVYLANNSADAEALVTGGLFDGYTFAGKLAVLFLGTPSNSLLSAAQQHHINPVPCSIPVMKGVGTYVETGFVWQIGAQEVKSLIVPLEVNWSTTQQPAHDCCSRCCVQSCV